MEHEAWRHLEVVLMVGFLCGVTLGFLSSMGEDLDTLFFFAQILLCITAAASWWFYSRQDPDLFIGFSDLPKFIKVRASEIKRGDLLGLKGRY